ncbi:MAG: rod shape-determining protein RodA [Candidatus Firestonebacteria bacterium]
MPGSKHNIRKFNRILLITVFLLNIIGLLMIYSATSSVEYSYFYHNSYLRQFIWVLIGFILMYLVSLVNYVVWIELAYKLYFFTLFLLLLLLIVGKSKFGGIRWFHLGPFSFQPSEFCKIVLILALTRFIIDNKGKIELLKGLLKTFLIIAVPLFLIVIQPDLGTALIFVPIVFFVLLIAGVRVKYLVVSFLSLIAISPIFWHLLKDYQRKRLMNFINPELDPLGSGYSIIQSKIAIGSGGLFGKGLLKGTQSQLNFLPEHHTDFIFSVIGEELGLIGILLILFLYFLFTMEGLKISIFAKDKTGKVLATGIVFMFVIQIFVNIGMTLGLLPVVGVPLPFLSYGGSSLLFSMILIGILLNIHYSSVGKFSG